MKVLFFLISLVGASYLVVSSLELDVFNMSPKNTLTSSESASQDSLASEATNKGVQTMEAETVLAEINAMQNNYQSMQSKIDSIESKHQAMEAKLSSLQSNQAKVAKVERKQSPSEQKGLNSSSVKLESASPFASYLQDDLQADSRAQSATFNSVSAHQGASVQSTLPQLSTTVTDSLSSASSQGNAQNKRLHQQALLRDLAQKRQFAAIDALQTSAR